MKKVNYKLLEAYIFECIDFSEYPKQPKSKKEKACYLLDICRSEKRYNNYNSERAIFVDWCYGLPTCFNIDYQQYKVLELCANFGLKPPKNDHELFDFWYGQLYESVVYLSK